MIPSEVRVPAATGRIGPRSGEDSFTQDTSPNLAGGKPLHEENSQ